MTNKKKLVDPEKRRAQIEESHRRASLADEGKESGGTGKPKKGDASTYEQILEALSTKKNLSSVDFSLLTKLRTIIANNPELLGKVRNLNEFLEELESNKVVGLDGKPLTEAQKAEIATKAKKLRFDRKTIEHKRPPPKFTPF